MKRNYNPFIKKLLKTIILIVPILYRPGNLAENYETYHTINELQVKGHVSE